MTGIELKFHELIWAIEGTYCSFFPNYVGIIKSWKLPKETEEEYIAFCKKLSEKTEASWPHYTNA